MTETFTFADIAREAIEEYNIKGNEQTLNTIAKQIKRYIEAHYDEGTEITEEIKNKLFTMNELGEYFRKMTDPEWRGKKYYLELANEMNKEHERQVKKMFEASYEEESIIDEIEQEFLSIRNFLIDKILFKNFIDTNDKNYQEGYKIISQNNFDDNLLNFVKTYFFNKYFNKESFDKDFVHYLSKYEGETVTPEMSLALERLTSEDNFKNYLKVKN